MIAPFPAQTAEPEYERIKPPIAFAVGNDRRSPYRFKITNVGWDEMKDSVIVEAFEGKRRLARSTWPKGFPNVYAAKARRQGRSDDVLITATCDGNQTQYTAVWLFSAKTRRMKLLADGVNNADDSLLARGNIREQGVDRWIFYPPRGDSPDGWFHRTWTYDRRLHRLTPGSWYARMLPR